MTINKQTIIKIIASRINVIFTFSGTSLIGYGVYLINVPAAFIVVGILLFGIGIPDKK